MPTAAKAWQLIGHDPDASRALSQATGISQVVAQLLLNREIRDAASARLFLDCPMTSLHSPHLLPGIPAAAERIWHAIQTNQKICIYGDYDVDGTTGTSILLGLLRLLKQDPLFVIPNRFQDGYGLNSKAVRQLAEDGVQLLITVDCGIASVAEAKLAQELGLDLIITDHHEFQQELPAATVLVHPHLPGTTYPHAGLSGAGVAFKLAWAVSQLASGSERVSPHFREHLLDNMALSAMGLISDVMPLRDENRAFVRYGLERMSRKPSIGQKALLEAAGLDPTKGIKAEDIAFKLGPRINAAGRLECARLVIELFTTNNPIRAREIAEYLEDLNSKRQTLERKITSQAKEIVEANGYHESAAIVLSSPDWHQGVVGIVASRMVDLYARPVLVIAEKPDDEPSSGSGRSVGDAPIHELLKACESQLLSHGGHAAACGFKVKPSRIDELRQKFAAAAQAYFQGVMPSPKLKLEAEVPLSALNFKLVEELDKLEPYGHGNPRPKFLGAGLQVEGTPRRIGQEERHLSFRVKQGQTSIRAVAFGMGDRLDELMAEGGACCLAFTPKINEWNDYRSVELSVEDLQAGAVPKLV